MANAAKHRTISRRRAATAAWLLLSALLPLGIVAGAQPPAPPAAVSPAVAVQKARQLVRLGQLRPAEQLLRGALATLGGAADGPQASGCLEQLTTIYLESGRYDDARKAATRYGRLLDNNPGRDAVNVGKRQQNDFILAQIAVARDDLPTAVEMLDRVLAIPGGLSDSDPLWQARLYALRGRIEERRKDAPAAAKAWSEVESRAKEVLEEPQQGAKPELLEAALGLLADSLLGQGRIEEAIAARERFLPRQAEDDAAGVRNLIEIADCYARLPSDVKQQRALEAAIELTQGRDKQKLVSQYADLLDRLAQVLDRQKQDAQARRRWTESATVYETLIAPVATEPRALERQMQFCQSLEAIYQRLGKWSDAVRITRRLLEHRQTVMLPDDPAIWRNKSALGFFYAKLQDVQNAKPLLLEAADYWRRRVPAAPVELARTLNNLAEVARNEGNFAEALKHLEEAVPICRQIYAADDLRLAEVYNNLAGVLSAQGRYKAAIDEYRRGAEICRAVQGAAAERAGQVLATTLINTAMLYKSQRQFHEAAQYCAEALEVQRRLTDVEESSLVPFYSALASLYVAQDQAHPTGPAAVSVDLAQASKFTQQARELCDQYKLIEQPAGIVVLQLEAMIHTRKAELDQGEQGFSRALELANRARQASLAAKSLTYLAEIALRRGHFQESADLAGEALKIHEQVQAYPNLRFMAYLTAARDAYALEHRDQAGEFLQRAIDLVEAPRAATVGAESERAEYFSQFVAAFDLLVDWSVADSHFDVALHAAEQGRNRTFLDQVRAAGVDLRQSLRDSPEAELLSGEKKVLGEYQAALADLRKAYARTAPADEIKQTVARIETLKQQYAQIETDIRDASPIYRNLLGSSRQAGSWDQIAGPILAPHTALLLYYLGHAQSHLFVIDGDTHAIQYFPLDVSDKLADRIGFTPGPLTRGVAAELVTAYVETLRNRDRALPRRGISKKTVESKKGDIDLAGHHLTVDEQLAFSEIILPTAAREHIGKLGPRMVTVVPDGAIDQLPLEALLLSTEPARYLLDVFPPITYAPSATIMAMLTGRHPGSADGHASLLTVGNPAYADADALEGYAAEIATGNEYRTLGGLLTPLPGTLAECRAVEEAIAGAPGSDVALLSGPDASEGNVRGKIVGRRFVHLAAHGLVDQRYGNLFGAIALSAPPTITSSADDGFLSLYEIHNLSLPDCELMVLSSCETNVGADRPLEAGSTIARAFLAAGVRDVVCSQWSVDDAATAALISDFFRGLAPQLEAKDSIDYATALRDARRTVRNQSAWEAPYFWAPFVLVGPGTSGPPAQAETKLAQ